MMTLIWNCDGTCKRKLCDIEVLESQEMARLYADSRRLDKNQASQLITEVFCPDCRARASDYWNDKTVFMKELGQEVQKRMERHRNKFWAAKLEAVKNAG